MPDAQPRWLFILSPPRSGSTLLSVMLGAHPSIIAPPELHLLRYDDFDSWLRHSPLAIASLCSLLESLGQPSDEAGVVARYRGRGTVELYREILALAKPGQLLVDKTPAYTAYDDRMSRVASLEPIGLWLIRHPLAVAHSHIERSRKKRGQRQPGQSLARFLRLSAGRRLREWTGGELRRELRRWREVNTRIEKFVSESPDERRIVVHYEELVRDPERTVDRLAQQLGIDADPRMLEPRENLPKGLQWGIGDETIYSRQGIDSESVDRWRQEFAAADIDAETLRLMERLGVE